MSEPTEIKPNTGNAAHAPDTSPVFPTQLPVLPLSDVVIFPHMVAPLLVTSIPSTRLVDDAVAGNRLIAVSLQKRPEQEHPRFADLQEIGCIARILRMLRFPDDTVRILVQGLQRARLLRAVSESPYLIAEIQTLQEISEPGIELSALARSAVAQFQRIVELSPTLPEELKIAVQNIDDPGKLADVIASNVNLSTEEKQGLLETADVRVRLSLLCTLLNREQEVLLLGSEIQSKVSRAIAKSQREYFLREQLKAIQKELGESEQPGGEVAELREKIEKAQMPAEVRKVALRELDRLATVPPAAAEYTVARTYLDWLIAVPWSQGTRDKLDIARARRILNEDHYNLDQVKKRILEYLSVLKLKSTVDGEAAVNKGPILCFVGPPGVGKTSLGMSIARALGRKFVRISLGGVRDEAEIRGHRRTYIGALPGRIIQGLRRVESNNPVFMLDEIDKVGTDFRGDPAAALLEVLDPQQNSTFSDHYLEVPFDLSRVMFITTANLLEPIPPALVDRMEIIELPGYTEQEKLHIATRHLIPQQLHEHGLKSSQLTIRKEALTGIIRHYTREAGVRNLDRAIATICRRTARRIVEGRARRICVTAKNLKDFLGPPQFHFDLAERRLDPGVAIALAWTSAGGDILFVEATQMPGKGHVTITGSLGDIMRESAQAALSYVRAHYRQLGIDPKFFDKHDIHIHVPAGAIPKDGPSAGLAMAVALASLLTGRTVRSAVAMSGEITLRGKVLPVGGVKEKVLAAARSGVHTVLLPEQNRKDLRDVPTDVRRKMKFVFVRTVGDAFNAAIPAPKSSRAVPAP
ncbi:MAG: endopeptidase La [Verrucomicrobiae bacterium]|nr:endopeptidase La [Verrucomicrobiae bacterium]